MTRIYFVSNREYHSNKITEVILTWFCFFYALLTKAHRIVVMENKQGDLTFC